MAILNQPKTWGNHEMLPDNKKQICCYLVKFAGKSIAENVVAATFSKTVRHDMQHTMRCSSNMQDCSSVVGELEN